TLPERIVCGVLHEPAGPRESIETARFSVVASGSCAAEFLVVVIGPANGRFAFASLGGLLGKIVQVALAKSAVVKPIVSHPAIDHGALRRCYFQRGMRRQQRHYDGEAF